MLLDFLKKIFTPEAEKPELPELTKPQIFALFHDNSQFYARQTAEQVKLRDVLVSNLSEYSDDTPIAPEEYKTAIKSVLDYAAREYKNTTQDTELVTTVMVNGFSKSLKTLSDKQIAASVQDFMAVSATPQDYAFSARTLTDVNVQQSREEELRRQAAYGSLYT